MKFRYEAPVKEVSVDFAPVIAARSTFKNEGIVWPRPNSRWPSGDKKAAIKAKGVNFVAKHNFFWRPSFEEPEKEISKHADDEGECRKKVHRLMKGLLKRVWSPNAKPELSSYHLKVRSLS